MSSTMGLSIKITVFIFLIDYATAALHTFRNHEDDSENQKVDILVNLVRNNLKNNGWTNILFVGTFPNKLYGELNTLPFTITVANIGEDKLQIDDVVPYSSNIIIIDCSSFEEFEDAIRETVYFPYWQTSANIILNYHAPYEKEVISKIFFAFWYYGVINVIIVQYNDISKIVLISYFNPYMSDHYKLNDLYGCWTARNIGSPINYSFNDSFICVRGCHNVSLPSKFRANHLGTCIGFDTLTITYENAKSKRSHLFEDKGKNLHGYVFQAFSLEVVPFLSIEYHKNGSHTLHNRDGMIWNTMAELFNFTINLSSINKTMKHNFDADVNIQQVFAFSQRKIDLILFPLYQFDLILAEVEYTFPFIDSGVCFLSRRAGYDIIVFNLKLLQTNLPLLIEFFLCFISTWFVFSIFHFEQRRRFSYDQAGKDLVNTFRTVLSINLHNPPKQQSFRIFLTIAIWSFFIINFNTQASIISLFSAKKRGRDVNTFEDVIEKGYSIEGMASPDAVLPDDEERYLIISSRMKAIPDMFSCVNNMVNDSHRFCTIDCAIGRYLVRNMLDEKGEQFLHIASEARIHSHYLNMILHKHSPLTEHFNHYMMRLFEAGLIKKWMDYRYKNVKEEVPVKPLDIDEMEGIFKCYFFLLGFSFIIFIIEMSHIFIQRIKPKMYWRHPF